MYLVRVCVILARKNVIYHNVSTADLHITFNQIHTKQMCIIHVSMYHTCTDNLKHAGLMEVDILLSGFRTSFSKFLVIFVERENK